MPFCETMKMRYDKGIYDDIGYTGIKELTAEEMDDINGGFVNFIAAAVCTVASVGCAVAAVIDTDNADMWNAASFGLGVGSSVLSLGVGSAVTIAGRTGAVAATRVATSRIAGNAGTAVVKGAMTVGEYQGYARAYTGIFGLPSLSIKGSLFAGSRLFQ